MLGPGFQYEVLGLGTLGGDAVQVWDINDVAQVVGSSTLASGERRAFLWSEGTMRGLETLDGWDGHARAINNHGEIVGYVRQGTCARAVLWRGETPVELFEGSSGDCNWNTADDINDSGHIIGYWGGLQTGPAFFWQGGQVTPLPNETGETGLATAHSINNLDEVVMQGGTG